MTNYKIRSKAHEVKENKKDQLPPLKITEVEGKKTNKFWVKIIVCEMINEMPHELLTAHLKANKPFKKELIDAFIKKEITIENIKKVAEAENVEIQIFTIICND